MTSVERIRSATPDDAAGIARVHVRTWQVAYRGLIPDTYLDAISVDQREENWRRSLDDDPAIVRVGVVDDTIVGFVTSGTSRDTDHDAAGGEIYAIYVDPGHWGVGIGRGLLRAAEDDLLAAGHSEATLWVLASNDRTRRFYETAGWHPDGATKVDEERPGIRLEEVRYRKRLGR